MKPSLQRLDSKEMAIMMRSCRHLVALVFCSAFAFLHPALSQGAASAAGSSPSSPIPISIPFPLPGKVTPRSAREIPSSDWSIGGEVLDRDMASYDEYKEYLGPLGAKAIRLQAGWAKTEKEKGVYQWAWLDNIIDDTLAQGLQPRLELSYGNPLYPGGGSADIGSPIPASDEAVKAWDAWARALVERYKNRISVWEVWNEPDLFGQATLDAYVALYIRTARIIREESPRSRIYALSLAHTAEYCENFLNAMDRQGKLGLIDAITFHYYAYNPDDLDFFPNCNRSSQSTLDPSNCGRVKTERPLARLRAL